ncbi:DEAD/DEAH box helicase family protein [bacterium]|nr:DEAD/DEAH box helicase family protein [bacterium]
MNIPSSFLTPQGDTPSVPTWPSINFEFLRDRNELLADLGAVAELYADFDPSSALVKLRKLMEMIVGEVYTAEGLPKPPRASTVELLAGDAFQAIVGPKVLPKFHAVRQHGNRGAHDESKTAAEARWLLKETHDIAAWFFVMFLEGDECLVGEFVEPDPDLLRDALDQRAGDAAVPSRHASVISDAYVSGTDDDAEPSEPLSEAEVEAFLAPLDGSLDEQVEQAELARLVAVDAEPSAEAVADAAARSAEVADALGFDEAETRDRLIDVMLVDAGWTLGDGGNVETERPVSGQPTDTGQGFVDYALLDDTGQPLAVLEAKRTSVSATRGREQAKLYADGVQNEDKANRRRPIIFYTNGFETWIWNDAAGETPRKLYGMYSPKSLLRIVLQRDEATSLTSVSPDKTMLNRWYQEASVKSVLERFAEGRRRALLVQATGTGKTRVAVGLVEAMSRANALKRVLFLCDRRELRKQARNAFADLTPDLSMCQYTSGAMPDTDRVVISTYQGFMKIHRDFDVGHFDLIIADESHRGIYRYYRDLFNYFDAREVGLTATPVQYMIRNTYQLFDCDDGHPTFLYEYEDAVDEGFLVPYRVVEHTTAFQRDGIDWDDLDDEQREDLLEDLPSASAGFSVAAADIDREVINRDTCRIVMRNLYEDGIRVDDGSKLGKSIVFARSHDHAVELVAMFDALYPGHGGRFCRVIDSHDPRAESLLDDFKDPAGDIRIAVSVDMLDTGVDVPEVVNLVFAKPVNSPVKFWQMIGRGTRLCPGLLGEGVDKSEFLIFDHWSNFRRFGTPTPERQPVATRSIQERIFHARIDLADVAIQAGETDIFDRVVESLRRDLADLPQDAISIMDRRKELAEVLAGGVLEAWDPNTVVDLRTTIAPLLRHRAVDRGDQAAWDELLLKAQIALLRGGTSFDDHRDDAIGWLDGLQMQLQQVRPHHTRIREVRLPAWWNAADADTIDAVREELRPIVHLRARTGPGPRSATVIDVEESADDIRISEGTPLSGGGANRAYQERVIRVIEQVLESSPAVEKIRRRESISTRELDELVGLILTEDPELSRNDLDGYFGDLPGGLEGLLRRLAGLDESALQAAFDGFRVSHDLTARQLRFLNMLRNHIKTAGGLAVRELYDAPFIAIDHDGLDGVFPDSGLSAEVLDLVAPYRLDVPAAPGDGPKTTDGDSA